MSAAAAATAGDWGEGGTRGALARGLTFTQVTRFAKDSVDAAVLEVLSLLNYILYEKTSEKQYPNGIRDKGRAGKDLVYFVTHAKAQRAGLKQPEVGHRL